MCRALDEMFEESTNRGIQMGIKQGIEQGIERGVKNTQIKIAIKMLVRNNQTLEEISEIVGLDLNALRELHLSPVQQSQRFLQVFDYFLQAF